MKRLLPLLLLLCLTSVAYGQTGQWTWMSGDSTAQPIPDERVPLGPNDVYGTRGVPSVDNKPPARIDAAEWRDKEGNLWMFGGYVAASGFYAEGYYGDLWKYNPKTNEWTWVDGGQGHYVFSSIGTRGAKGAASTSYGPGGRRGALSWTDGDGNLWLMGGTGRERYYTVYNDLWKFNPSTLEWAWMGGGIVYGGGQGGGSQTYIYSQYGIKGVPSTENFPAPLTRPVSRIFDQDLTWTDSDGKLWLQENVMWRYDPQTTEWTWMNGDLTYRNGVVFPNSIRYGTKGVSSADNFPGTTGAGSWRDKYGFLWLYTRDELWKYNTASNEWTWISGDTLTNLAPVYGQKGVPSVNNTPGEVNEAESWTDLSGNFWLLHGDDLWRYDPDTGEWTWMSGDANFYGIYGTKGVASPGNEPGARSGAVSWTDNHNNLWLFGGLGRANSNYGYLNDLWKYTIKSTPTPFITTSLPGNDYYKGARVAISYTAQGSFGPDNLFIVELSDASGSFLNPVIIGSIKASTSGTINVSIPLTTPAASGYRIRVVSNLPEIRGTDNGADITIRDLPATSVSSQHTITTNPLISNVLYQGKEVSVAYTATGTYNPGTVFHAQLSDATGSFASPAFIGSVTATGSGTITATVPAATPAGTAYRIRVITVAGNEPVIGSDNGTALTIAPQPPFPALSGSWTWESGDNVINQPGIYGTKGVASTENKPGAREGAVSWKDKNGNLWLFGGFGYASGTATGFLNDLWKYNPTAREWTWVSGDNVTNQVGVYGTKGVTIPAAKPGARKGAAGWIDKSGNLWLYGGNANDGQGGELNDLWKYDVALNQWTWISGDPITVAQGIAVNFDSYPFKGIYGSKGVPSVNNKPPAKTQALAWTDNDGNFWLYSGYAYYGYLSGHMTDLWKFNPSTTEWTFVTSTTAFTNADGIARYGVKGVASPDNKPLGRQDAVGWVDKDNNLWMYGGTTTYSNVENVFFLSFSRILADLWKFNTAIGQWVWMGGEKFIPPVYLQIDPLPSSPVVRGTQGVPSVDNQPGAARSAVSWTDAAGKFWLLNRDDLWRYDPLNNTWTWVSGDENDPGVYGTKGTSSPSNEPGARNEAVSWTDADGKFWLFGGRGFASTPTSGYLNDLWHFGSETEKQNLTTLPLASSVCAGSKVMVRFTSNHSFHPGNTFTVQLSDAAGNFNKATNVGSITSTIAQVIEATIPVTTPAGTGYRLRVIASSPSITGTDNGSNLSINVQPTITVSGGSFVSPGLLYKYYEGKWTSLPDFGGLTPVATGITDGVNLAPKRRDDNYAFLWEGLITVPAAGTYYFETASDDGSKLYIGEYGHYVTPVVNNDGEHAERMAGGAYTFPAAGTYPIAITFFEAGGGETMKVYWTSAEAGIGTKTLIPATAFSHYNYHPASPGLSYKYYEGDFKDHLPDFGGLTPVASGTVGGIDLSPKRRSDKFAFLWEGKIFIPKGGTYYFETRSDDGSKLYIGNYGHYITPVVDNNGEHPMQYRGGSYTFPRAGMYPIAVSFFEAYGGEGIELYWTAPEAGIPQRTMIPNSAFREVMGSGNSDCVAAGSTLTASEGEGYLWSTGETTRSIVVKQNGSYTVTVTKGGCPATSEPTIITCADNSVTQMGSVAKGNADNLAMQPMFTLVASPNPSTTHFTLRITGIKSGVAATLMVSDALGRVVERRSVGSNGQLTLGAGYRPGMYQVQLTQEAQSKTVRLIKGAH